MMRRCQISTAALAATVASVAAFTSPSTSPAARCTPSVQFTDVPNQVSVENPLRVLVAGGGIGGLALANSLVKVPHVSVTVIERAKKFKRFGGPIQLASNALQILKEMDPAMFDEIMDRFTFTGNKMNGIKDGIRNDWYALFDLESPAEKRHMPYTGVIERPELQEIYLNNLPGGTVMNGDAVSSYVVNNEGYGVSVITESGEIVEGDVLRSQTLACKSQATANIS